MKTPRFLLHSIVFHCCMILCLATIWKTEDAYITDDVVEDDEPTVTEASNVCTAPNGRQGRCVPIQECNPFYDFFAGGQRDSQLEILQGFQEYLNATESASCVPDDIPATTESDQQLYKGSFKVKSGDTFTPSLSNPDSPEYRKKSAKYKEYLDTLYSQSAVKNEYVGSEILAFEGDVNGHFQVYFRIQADAHGARFDAGDIFVILADALKNSNGILTESIIVDQDTLAVGIAPSKRAVYACCTSLKFSNVKSISLDKYTEKNPDNTSEKAPQLQLAMSEQTESKIVSGSPATPGEYPFAVAILESGRQFCGGSLIDSQWVLSAAHCFDQFTSQKVRQLIIKVGDHDISRVGEVQHQDAHVSKLFLHPGFFRSKGYFRDDVALVKLRKPVTPFNNIRAISLHSGNPNINQGLVETVVCGWGKTCSSACRQSTVLLKTKIQVISNTDCSQRYAGTQAPPITQNMVCASGQSSADACNGDSGGPLIINHGGVVQQIGVVSWGIGVYTRVSNFVNWVQKHKNKG